MMKKILLLLAPILLLSVSPSAFAHHSYAMFDKTKEVHLSGTVKKFDWHNPHVFIIVEVPNEETGDVDDWTIETGSPNMLRRMGWSHGSLKTGDKIDLVINPRVDGSTGGGLVEASVDGEVIGNPHP